MLKQNKKGFERIGTFLPLYGKDHKLREVYIKHQILLLWDRAVKELLPEAGENTKAINYEHGKLTVACLSENIGWKVKSLVKEIITVLNKLLGRMVVYSLAVEY